MTSVAVPTKESILSALHEVKDPEIPVLSVVDLGVITDVDISDSDITVTMTPTFVGCPAIEVMKSDVKSVLDRIDGYHGRVIVNYDIPWSSSRLSEAGRKALLSVGFAPPVEYTMAMELDVLSQVKCPHCGSLSTHMQSPFGPTLCRSVHYCESCLQAFEQFKPV